MKKFLVVILLIALVSSIVGCSQTVAHQHTFDSPTCLKPATCADCGEIKGTTVDHDTTNGKCSMCGLDYYDALIDLLEKEGVKQDDKSSNAYSYSVEEGDYVFILAIQKNGLMKMQVREFPSSTMILFTIEFDGSNVKKQKYDWNYQYSNIYSRTEEISGQLEASDFSRSTSALSYSNSTASSSSKATQYAKESAKMLKFALEQTKIFMEKGDQDISLVNFGFEYFE